MRFDQRIKAIANVQTSPRSGEQVGIPRYRLFRGPALFSQGFRPFFLGAAVWAAAAVMLWLAMMRGDVSLPTGFVPVRWHAHEMIFGFAAAAVAGFMLTAIPNWTGRMPLQGLPLIVLFGAWVLGRVVVATSTLAGASIAAIIDMSFLIALAAIVLREIVAGKNWRNMPMPIAIAILIVANGLMHLDALGWSSTDRLGERLGLATLVLLISLIGGRIIPSFTRNWIVKRGERSIPVPFGRFDVATIFVVLMALTLWAFIPDGQLSGIALAVAGLLSFVRLFRWRGLHALSEPMLLVLHVGYLWVAMGLGLLGISILFPRLIPLPAGLHALAAGAIGTMILAVMTRATRGHTGRPVAADHGTASIYLLVTLGAVLRVMAPFFEEAYMLLLMASAATWTAAFCLFVILYGHMLATPTPDRAAVSRKP